MTLNAEIWGLDIVLLQLMISQTSKSEADSSTQRRHRRDIYPLHETQIALTLRAAVMRIAIPRKPKTKPRLRLEA